MDDDFNVKGRMLTRITELPHVSFVDLSRCLQKHTPQDMRNEMAGFGLDDYLAIYKCRPKADHDYVDL